MPDSYQHFSPLTPLRYAVGVGWRGYKRYQEMRAIIPPKAVGHIDNLGNRVRNRLETLGFNPTNHSRRSEAILDLLYQELQRFENQTQLESRAEQIYAQILRNSIVDWELILLPKRNDIFELFSIEREDTFATVKMRYRQLARLLHPDKPYGDADRMSEVNHAYNLLRRMLGEH